MKGVDPRASERPTVLLVEPDVLVRQPTSEYLRQCGYRVLECGNTDEALLVLKVAKMTVDIALSDAKAPGKRDGFGLARWLRKNRPAVTVILVGTIATEANKAGDLCQEGPHLAKPYEPQLLFDRIKRALAARDRATRL